MPTLEFQVAMNMVRKEAALQGVDPDHAATLMGIENRGNSTVSTDTMSPAGAQGIMQVMPATRMALEKQGFLPLGLDYSKPENQVKAGVAAMKEVQSRGITDKIEQALSYNASPAVLEAYRAGKPIPAEAAEYIKIYANKIGAKMPSYSERSSGSTSSVSMPEDMAQGIKDSQAKFSTAAGGFQTQMEALMQQMTGISSNTQDAVKKGGDAAATVATTGGDIEAAKLDRAQENLNFFGINPADDGSAIFKNQQTLLAAKAQRSGLQEQISTLRSTNVLSDPLAWIVNNFKALPLIEQDRAIGAKEAYALKNISELQAIAHNQSALQPAQVQEQIKAQALAQATVAKADAEAKIGQLQGANLQVQARTLQENLNIMQADVQTRVAAARLFMERNRDAWGMGTGTAADKAAEDKLAPINQALKSLNPDFKPFNAETYKSVNPELKSRLDLLSTGKLGNDLGEAVSTLHQVFGVNGIQGIMQTNAPLGLLLTNAAKGGTDALRAMEGKIEGDKTGMTKEPPDLRQAKTPQDRLEWGIRQWQAEKLQELAIRDNTKLKTDNPYKVNLAAMSRLPELKGNTFAKYIQESLAKSPPGSNMVVDDRAVFSQAAAMVSTGADINAVSNQLEELYIKAYKAQTSTSSTTTMGLPYKPDYVLRMAITGEPRPVQALNAVDIKRWLTEQIQRTTARDAAVQGGVDQASAGFFQ